MAARDIQPLELILFERPLALGPKFYDTTQKVMQFCFIGRSCRFLSILEIFNQFGQFGPLEFDDFLSIS